MGCVDGSKVEVTTVNRSPEIDSTVMGLGLTIVDRRPPIVGFGLGFSKMHDGLEGF